MLFLGLSEHHCAQVASYNLVNSVLPNVGNEDTRASSNVQHALAPGKRCPSYDTLQAFFDLVRYGLIEVVSLLSKNLLLVLVMASPDYS